MTLYEALKQHPTKQFKIISSRHDSDLLGFRVDHSDLWSALEYCISNTERYMAQLAYIDIWEIDLDNMTVLLDD